MLAPHYLAAAGWLAGWLLLTRVPRLPAIRREDPVTADATGDAAADEPVTIVIPARNEALRLPHLLEDLTTFRPHGARVVVVDDHSEDDTAGIARRFDDVAVMEAPPRPEGWTGKSWANHIGAKRAEAGILVFLDADVRLSEGALDRAIATWRRRKGLLSVWPYHTVKRLYEHVSALPGTVTLLVAGCGSLLPPRPPRSAFGPVLITSTDAYARIGGHAAIRSEVVDDFAIAARYANAGYDVTNYGGGRDISFRMYPEGLRSLVEGWTKNFAHGAGRTPVWRFLLLLFWLTCSIGALTWAHGLRYPESVALYGLFALQFFVFFRQVGRFGIVDALLYPLHVAALALLFLSSIWQTYVRRKVMWRGREVAIQSASRDVS